MKSGTLDKADFYRMSSLGRISGCYVKNLLFNCGVMVERAQEEIPAITHLLKLRFNGPQNQKVLLDGGNVGPEVSDVLFFSDLHGFDARRNIKKM